MHQGVELFQTLAALENNGREATAVDAAILVENFAAKRGDHAIVSFPAGFNYLVAELVGLHQETAQIPERAPHETFPAGEAAGESDCQHFESGCRQQQAAAISK
jgi:hypothetical protein